MIASLLHHGKEQSIMGWSSGYYSRKELIDYLTKSWTSGDNTTACLKVTKGNNLWVVLEQTKSGSEEKQRSSSAS